MNGDWNIVNSEALHTKAAKGILLISPFLYIFLQYILIAPYGKHSASSPKWNWGPKINAKLAWFILELPNLFWIFYAYWNRNEDAFASSANGLLLSLFVIHYINRCIVYPFRISAKSNPVNLSIISAGFLFCLMNGWWVILEQWAVATFFRRLTFIFHQKKCTCNSSVSISNLTFLLGPSNPFAQITGYKQCNTAYFTPTLRIITSLQLLSPEPSSGSQDSSLTSNQTVSSAHSVIHLPQTSTKYQKADSSVMYLEQTFLERL